MATDCIAQVTFNFDPKRKPIVDAFDQPHASSDGGAILLKGIDTQWGLTWRLAACLEDDRQPGKVRRSNCSGNGSLASPAATPTATTPPGWPTMRSTSSCSSAIPSPGRRWPRSSRGRGLRMPWGRAR
jgi:hypothetical protein